MDSEDRVTWGDPIRVTEIVDKYSYPGEARRLARIARRFPGTDATLSDSECLEHALDPLIEGLLEAGHGDLEGSPDYWSEELSVAFEATCYGDALVSAWRKFAELPAPERLLVIAAAEGWR